MKIFKKMKILNKYFSILLVLGTVQVQANHKNTTAEVLGTVQVQATPKNTPAEEIRKLLKASILVNKANIDDLSKMYNLSRIADREKDVKIINDCNFFKSIINAKIKNRTKAIKLLRSGNIIGEDLMDKIELSELIKKEFNKELDNFYKFYIEKIKAEKNKKKNKASNNKTSDSDRIYDSFVVVGENQSENQTAYNMNAKGNDFRQATVVPSQNFLGYIGKGVAYLGNGVAYLGKGIGNGLRYFCGS